MKPGHTPDQGEADAGATAGAISAPEAIEESVFWVAGHAGPWTSTTTRPGRRTVTLTAVSRAVSRIALSTILRTAMSIRAVLLEQMNCGSSGARIRIRASRRMAIPAISSQTSARSRTYLPYGARGPSRLGLCEAAASDHHCREIVQLTRYRVTRRTPRQPLCLQHDDSERRAQLMGDIRGKLLLILEGSLQLPQRDIDRCDDILLNSSGRLSAGNGASDPPSATVWPSNSANAAMRRNGRSADIVVSSIAMLRAGMMNRQGTRTCSQISSATTSNHRCAGSPTMTTWTQYDRSPTSK